MHRLYLKLQIFFDSANSSFIHDSIWMPVMQILPVNLELVFNPKIELFFYFKSKTGFEPGLHKSKVELNMLGYPQSNECVIC